MKENNITYAQYKEDLTIAALLHDVKNGFYIDVGANHPDIDSVTKYFYNRGWRGINIEPIPRLFQLFEKRRPRDINLNCGVGEEESTLTFFEYPEIDGHSTFSTDTRERFDTKTKHIKYPVKVRTLENILKEVNPAKIDFLKIDVEGFEYEVIKGNNWKQYRPQVLCVEGDHKHKNWDTYLSSHDYIKVLSDGLNDYYLAKEVSSRIEGLSERIVSINRGALYEHQEAIRQDYEKQLKLLHKTQKILSEQNEKLTQECRQLNMSSLQGKQIKSKIKIITKHLLLDSRNPEK